MNNEVKSKRQCSAVQPGRRPMTVLALSTKAFCVSGHTVWNSLIDNCKQAELVTAFKCNLKSELFYLAYGEQSINQGLVIALHSTYGTIQICN